MLICAQVIERKIHGEEAGYNDIATWKWGQLLDTFNGYNPPKKTKSLLASTRGELEQILADPEFAKAEQIQLLEVVMGRQDAPEALIKQGKLVSRSPPVLLTWAKLTLSGACRPAEFGTQCCLSSNSGGVGGDLFRISPLLVHSVFSKS